MDNKEHIRINDITELYNGKSEDIIPTLEDNSIDLVVTSPPYNVDLGNNRYNNIYSYDLYNDNLSHQEYISWLKDIFEKIYEKLKSGGRICVNIGDPKNGRIPTHSDIIHFMSKELKYIPMANILWMKKQVANRFAWGSFNSPSCPSFPEPFEYILIFAKDNIRLQEKGESDILPEEFKKWAYSVWDFPPESQMKKIGHPACVDSETECLTDNGWKKYNELKIGDKIASFNIDKNYLEWEVVNDITIYQHNDVAIKVDGRSINMLLSENHTSVINKYYKSKNKPEYRKVIASDLNKKDVIPCSSIWNPKDNFNNKRMNKDLASLLGWFLSEGHYIREKYNGKIYSIGITQSETKNPDKVMKIENVLNKLKAYYRKDIRTRKHTYNKDISSTVVTFYISKKIKDKILKLTKIDKKIPENILLWSKKSLAAFFWAMVEGDGRRRKNSKSFSFVQHKDKICLDIMQAIGLRLGYDSNVFYKNNYVEFTFRKHKCLRNAKKSLIQKVKYDGIMWCPFVNKNNTFVARRQGKVFITGNCFPVEIPYRLIKMLTWKDALVLDPFNGSGTTGVACNKLGRKYIGIEISENYCDITKNRINNIRPLSEVDAFAV
jgi:DNA modification methylase